MKTIKHHSILCLLLLFSLGMQAKINMPAIFCDNMVLQQNTKVAIWGWAKANSNVELQTSWNGQKYTAKSDGKGKWKLEVQTPVASFTNHEIEISDGEKHLIKNVLIGEVWICSGQSNMELTMKGYHSQPTENSVEALLNSKNDNIRLFTVGRSSTTELQDDCEGSWELASYKTVADFSATAYYFGRMLNKMVDVPIGLINTSWPGASIQTWMPEEAFRDIPEKTIPKTKEDIKLVNHDPTLLFNGMVNPLVGYGIKGAIWYQGETNRNEPDLYVKMFDNMVKSWRKAWNVGEFPVYYVQIAPFNYPDGLNSALIREAQEKCMKVTPNTGMAVVMDSNSPNCIHPPQKREAGERLAYWALNKDYGFKEIPYKSPTVTKVEIEGYMIILTVDVPAKPGLTSYDKDVNNFVIAGKNKIFYPAKAAVFGNRIYLFSPRIPDPVTARYCFDHTSASEIFAIEGELPMSSFRLDDWTIE